MSRVLRLHLVPRGASHRHWWLLLRSAACACVVLAVAACLDDGVAEPGPGAVRLAIQAQVVGGRVVEISVGYRRLNPDESVLLMALPTDPSRVTVAPGTTQVPVNVQIGECLRDPRRMRAANRPDACLLVIDLRLLDDGDRVLDSQRVEPASAAPGETVTLTPVSLRRPEVVVTPASLIFESRAGAEGLPAAQQVGIGNAGGGTLGTITTTVNYAKGADWLSVTLEGEGSFLRLQPTTTDLAPDRYEATVHVRASGAGDATHTVEIRYDVTAVPTHVLAISGAGTGNGRVKSEPGGIDCTISAGANLGACTAEFTDGTRVFLDATPAAGSDFAGWGGACSGTGECQVVIDQPRTVSAGFARLRHVLAVSGAGSGTGSVTSDPAGIDCAIASGEASGACSAEFDSGTSITLTATPAATSTFTAWGGSCNASGGAPTCSIIVDGPKQAVAEFGAGSYSVVIDGLGQGTGRVTSQAGLTPAIDCLVEDGRESGTCSATYPAGTRVELRASTIPGSGSNFHRWEGACTGTTQPCVPPATGGTTATVGARFSFDRCQVRQAHVLLTTSQGTLTQDDCQVFDGRYRGGWSVSLENQELFQVILSSSVWIELWVEPVAGAIWFSRGALTITSQKVLAPAGAVGLSALNVEPNRLGSYAIETRRTAFGGCEILRTTFGISAAFELTSGIGGDCQYVASNRAEASRADRFTIFVPSGRTLRVSVESKSFEPMIEFRDGMDDSKWDGSVLGTTASHEGGQTATLTRTGGGYVAVWVTSRTVGGIGQYSIRIDP